MSEHTEPVPGKGIAATTAGRRVLIGNLALLEQYRVADTVGAAQAAQEFASAWRTPMIVAVDDAVLGVLAVADQVRADAAHMVAKLHRAGVKKVVMLTGDARLVADAIGEDTGVDEVHAGLLPEGKLVVVQDLQRRPCPGRRQHRVAMGAAGSAVAVETADIALMD